MNDTSDDERPCLPTSGVYRHWKGPHYLVLGIAHDADGGEDRVVYVPLYEVAGAPLAVRRVSDWQQSVPTPDGPRPRFTRVGDRLP